MAQHRYRETAQGFTPMPQSDAAFRADIERRRSNAAAPHLDSRTKRARTRSDAKRKAIREF